MAFVLKNERHSSDTLRVKISFDAECTYSNETQLLHTVGRVLVRLLSVAVIWCASYSATSQAVVSPAARGADVSAEGVSSGGTGVSSTVLNPLDTSAAVTASQQTDSFYLVPDLLKGIWYNANRYVIFDAGYTQQFTNEAHEVKTGDVPQLVLRTFYTWYDDRAAESAQYTKKTGSETANVRHSTSTRDRDNTTSSPAEELSIRFVPLVEQSFPASYNMPVILSDGSTLTAKDIPSGAWDLEITYPHSRTVYHVPVAVIGNSLYLHFTVKALASEEEGTPPDRSSPSSRQQTNIVSNGTHFAETDSALVAGAADSRLLGVWKDYGSASGVLISPPVTSTELVSYYITNDAVYYLRYWQTDMEFDPEALALFSDGDKEFTVKKHLYVGDKNYTCVNGRGTKIRNVEKSSSLPDSYTVNEVVIQKKVVDENGMEQVVTQNVSTICALGKPYLTLTDGKQSIEQLVVAANTRRKPLPPPLFPPHGVLDFHWEIIKDLNTYNRVLSLGKQ